MAGVPHGYGLRGQGDFQFLKMMVEEIERGNYTPGSTFRKESELYVYEKFRSVFGRVHSNRLLKSRLQILSRKYKIFSELLNKPGISWDMKKNVVYGNEKLLREKYKYRCRNGHYYGEKHFDLMCQVFESGVKFY